METVSVQPDLTCEQFYAKNIASMAADPDNYREFFQMLWQANGETVFKIAYCYLGSEEDARDICQEAFVRAMGYLQKGGLAGREPNFRAWLRTITRNLVFDRFRRQQKAPVRLGEEALQVIPVDQPPDRRMITSEDLERLTQCMDRLTGRSRELFLLREVDGLSEKEIASRLATTANSVCVSLHRARKVLRHCVETGAAVERKS